MRPGISRVICLLLATSLLQACSSFFKKDIKEGEIDYKAESVDAKDRSSMTVPDKMVVKFKDNYVAAELEAGLGFAKMKFISDPVKKQFLSQVFFFEKKQSKMDNDEIKKTNYYMPDYDVEYGNQTKEIAGYTCKNATIKFKDGSPSYDVWFTKDISIKDPNWSNAYYKIDGVLMDYKLKKYGLELHFTATSVSEATIDQSYFTIPKEYESVPNSELEKMFQGFYQ
jgi:GLPGLI family protein